MYQALKNYFGKKVTVCTYQYGENYTGTICYMYGEGQYSIICLKTGDQESLVRVCDIKGVTYYGEYEDRN